MTAGVEPATVRHSGKTGAQEDAHAAAEEVDRDISDSMPDEEPEVLSRTPRFHRMRTEWAPSEGAIMSGVKAEVQRVLDTVFRDAMGLILEIQDTIRVPMIIDGIESDTQWRRNAYGVIEEDFTRLTQKQISDYLGRLAVRLFAWEQEAASLWGDALFAKAHFEERYAIAYDEPTGRQTVDHRQAYANADAAEERYHAVFRTLVSRHADALVRSMERLCQRLKDAMAS